MSKFPKKLLFLLMAPVVMHCQPAVAQPTRLTVFVHGTVASTLRIAERLHAITHAVLERFRDHPWLGEDQCLLQRGFVEVARDQLTQWQNASLPASEYGKACYPIITAYDCAAGNQLHHKYALFGWSGDLYTVERQKSGHALYAALCAWADAEFAATGEYPEINIVAHSHGGTVALWMADAELKQNKGLKIACLHMWGTPLEESLIPLVGSSVFTTIINHFSAGDRVQPIDYTTETKHSVRRFAEVKGLDFAAFKKKHPHLKRHDMQWMVGNDTKKIGHVNMWFLNKSTKALECLDILPVVVLEPMVHGLLGQLADVFEVKASVTDNICRNHISVALHVQDAAGKKIVRVSDNKYHCLTDCQTLIKKLWRPHSTSRVLVINKTTRTIIYDAIRNK